MIPQTFAIFSSLLLTVSALAAPAHYACVQADNLKDSSSQTVKFNANIDVEAIKAAKMGDTVTLYTVDAKDNVGENIAVISKVVQILPDGNLALADKQPDGIVHVQIQDAPAKIAFEYFLREGPWGLVGPDILCVLAQGN